MTTKKSTASTYWLYLALAVVAWPASVYAVGSCRAIFVSQDAAFIEGLKVPEARLSDDREKSWLEDVKKKCARGGALRFCKDLSYDYVEFYEGNDLLGQVSFFTPEDSPEVVEIAKIHVREEARNRGIATALLQRAIELSGSRVSEITAELADTNYNAILIEYDAITNPQSPRYIPGLTRAQANKLAVQAAPFVKALKQLGFSSIDEVYIYWVLDTSEPYARDIRVRLGR